jgi:glycine betaine/choline ABC-type transport system substrate-binding protein
VKNCNEPPHGKAENTKKELLHMRNILKASCVALLVLSVTMVGGFGTAALAADQDPMEYKGSVRLGAQTVNESVVLAWMAKLLLDEYTGLDVKINTEFAASSVLH